MWQLLLLLLMMHVGPLLQSCEQTAKGANAVQRHWPLQLARYAQLLQHNLHHKTPTNRKGGSLRRLFHATKHRVCSCDGAAKQWHNQSVSCPSRCQWFI